MVSFRGPIHILCLRAGEESFWDVDDFQSHWRCNDKKAIKELYSDRKWKVLGRHCKTSRVVKVSAVKKRSKEGVCMRLMFPSCAYGLLVFNFRIPHGKRRKDWRDKGLICLVSGLHVHYILWNACTTLLVKQLIQWIGFSCNLHGREPCPSDDQPAHRYGIVVDSKVPVHDQVLLTHASSLAELRDLVRAMVKSLDSDELTEAFHHLVQKDKNDINELRMVRWRDVPFFIN